MTDVGRVKSGKFERCVDVCCGWMAKLWRFQRLSLCNQVVCVLVSVMSAAVVDIARNPSYLETGSARLAKW